MNINDKNIALIFAGGVGSRMGNADIPKQFLEYNGKPIIMYTIDHFQQHEQIDEIVVVCIESWIDHLVECCKKFNTTKLKKIVPGGNSSHESIWFGIQAIKQLHPSEQNLNVLIHDGVRPLIDKELIDRNLSDLKEYGTSISAIAAFETVAITNKDQTVTKTINRHDCRLLRAPQCFRFNEIYEAHLKAQQDSFFEAVDSATLMEHYGYTLHITLCSTNNIKITTPIDFSVFKVITEQLNETENYE